jgi:hypothetical protein
LAVDHPTSICFALADGACPIAAVSGDVPAWTEFISMLIDRAARHSFDAWHAHGRELQDIMSARLSERAPLSDAALERLREARFDMIYLPILNDAAARAGARADACLQTVSAILERAERNRERWCIPELLRIKGQLTASKGTPESLSEAVASLEESLRLAREQEALAWELRSATSLGRLRHAQGRSDEAYELVAPVYARFSEGFATADLRAAAALLDETR